MPTFILQERGQALAIPSIAASTLVVAACALPFASTAHSEVGTVPVPESPCNLPTASSLIIWQHAPGVQDRSVYASESEPLQLQTHARYVAGRPANRPRLLFQNRVVFRQSGLRCLCVARSTIEKSHRRSRRLLT